MDLIDRYVNEVGRRLPRKGRADVQAELRSLLQDTLEDRVEGKATEEDVVAVLEEFGPPEKVAASYQPDWQYLVGPELFPIFKIVLGAVLLALTIGLTVAFFMGALVSPFEPSELGWQLLDFLGGYFQTLLFAFAAIVVVFAVLQRAGVRPDQEPEGEWNPRTLPDVKDVDVVGRGESVAAIAFLLVFLVLLNTFGDGTVIVTGWEQLPILANIVQDNLVWLNAAILLGIGLNIVLLWQGRWHLYTRVAKLGIDLFWVYIMYGMLTALAAERETLIAYGFVEPLPTMFFRLGFIILPVVALLIFVNFMKVVLQSARGQEWGRRVKFS
jgi:hypothetical protein